jgi:hypothetical protein
MEYRELGYYKKKKILKNSNYLDLTPLRKFKHELDKDGNVVILIPRFTGFFLGKLLQPRLKNPFIKIHLDEAGTTTWLLTDGKKNVREICQIAEEKLGSRIHQAYDRITTFFSGLYMQKFITFNEILK